MLPKISHPLFVFKRPSNGEEVKYRPFNTKEEKILLMAREGSSELNIYDTVLQIVNNCIVTPNMDVTKWPTFDVELLYVKIRSKSIGEEIEVNYTPEAGGKKYEAVLDLDEAYIDISEEQTKKKYRTIMLDSNIGILLKWPTFTQLAEFAFYCRGVKDGLIEASPEQVLERSFKFFADCIEQVFNGDDVMSRNNGDFSDADILQFVSDMPPAKYAELQKFVDRVPVLRYKGKYLDETGNFKTFEVNGFINFFTL